MLKQGAENDDQGSFLVGTRAQTILEINGSCRSQEILIFLTYLNRKNGLSRQHHVLLPPTPYSSPPSSSFSSSSPQF